MGTCPPTVAILAQLIEDTCGIHYGPRDGELLAGKLEAHVRERRAGTLLDYHRRLRDDDPDGVELGKLIEAIVVRETYFFREPAPLAQLVEHVVEVVRSRGRARVWSAACSTGEEPFTLAMLLDDRDVLDRVELVASDLSAVAIERARTGRHGKRALRPGHPRELAARYLAVRDDGFAVAPRIRDAVAFHRINLLDDAAISGLGLFDAIACRNVLIYFREDGIVAVADRLARSLAPGGLIAVGVSESFLRVGTGLACEERGNAFLYRSAR